MLTQKLQQTAYFSLIRSLMEYGATVWDTYQKYNTKKIEKDRTAMLVKQCYGRYSSCSNMINEWGWPPWVDNSWDGLLFLKGDRRLD